MRAVQTQIDRNRRFEGRQVPIVMSAEIQRIADARELEDPFGALFSQRKFPPCTLP
jgi:hypothetical protein